MRVLGERTKYIVEQLASGRTATSLGQELGISKQRVIQIVQQEWNRKTNLTLVIPKKNQYNISEIKVLRNIKGLTISKAAKAIGISTPLYSKIERGNPVKIKTARAIAQFYEKPLEELFDIPQN